MNFFDSEFARYARATFKRRRGLSLLLALVVCWIVVGLVGFGIYMAVKHVIGV